VNNPKESTQQSEHGESVKSRILEYYFLTRNFCKLQQCGAQASCGHFFYRKNKVITHRQRYFSCEHGSQIMMLQQACRSQLAICTYTKLTGHHITIKGTYTVCTHIYRPVLTNGPPGPGPRAANFQGRHIKKIEIEVWYAGKKRLSMREKFKGDLY